MWPDWVSNPGSMSQVPYQLRYVARLLSIQNVTNNRIRTKATAYLVLLPLTA